MSSIDPDVVEDNFRHDLPNVPVSRGLTGSIKARYRFDILVIFKLTQRHAHIYATHPLLYALMFGGDRYGYASDEKRHFEKVFAQWFEIRYRKHILQDTTK
jgi:hypothetical protein